MSRYSLFTIAAASVIACGGAAATSNPEVPMGIVSASASASTLPPPNAVSVVRFDDLGVSYALKPGFHVVGDDDLASRVRASANPRLTAALQSRGSQKKGVPLLTLSKEDQSDGLTLTITATVVPKDATPSELLTHQQTVMAENLDGFKITDGPREVTRDGVAGVELGDHYGLRGANPKKVVSLMGLYVRDGVAYAIVAAWPDGPQTRTDEGKALLDGLHFYAATPQ